MRTRMTVLLATSGELPRGEPGAPALDAALATRGIEARWVVWDDPADGVTRYPGPPSTETVVIISARDDATARRTQFYRQVMGRLGYTALARCTGVRTRSVLVLAGIGFVGLGAYYGLVWFISPGIMAFGDVRFAALIGLALGPLGVPVLVVSVLAAAVLSVLALVPLRVGGKAIKRKIPYGPFLAGGALVAIVVGQVLNGW